MSGGMTEAAGSAHAGGSTGAPIAPPIRVAAAVVRDGSRILLTQRPPGGPLGLAWEFPGGKIEPGESAEAALVREIGEELGVAATVHETLGVSRHRYTHGLEVEVVFLRCSLGGAAITPSAAVHSIGWFDPGEIALGDVLEADRAFLKSLGARG